MPGEVRVRAVRLGDAIRYPNGLPLLCVSAAEGGSEDLTITRLFCYKQDCVPTETPCVVRISDFNHWLPVPDGPVARAAVQERNDGKTILVPLSLCLTACTPSTTGDWMGAAIRRHSIHHSSSEDTASQKSRGQICRPIPRV